MNHLKNRKQETGIRDRGCRAEPPYEPDCGRCCAWGAAARRRLPAGHAGPAQDGSAARLRFLCRSSWRASPGSGHRGSRPASRRHIFLHRRGAGAKWLQAGAGPDAVFPVTMKVLERGQERFNIYCTPCHSRVGNGLGEIVQRGYKPAANFHDQVRMSQPLSHYFYVMTHGYGAMPDYSAQLTPSDRWAVAAYIRALQLSQAATAKDVPAGTQIRNLKDVATGEGHPEYAQPWPCRRRRCRPIRTLPARERRAWLRLIRRIRRSGSRKQTGPRGPEVRTSGMAHERQPGFSRGGAPRRSRRAGFCRRLEPRARGRSNIRRHRRDSCIPGPGAGRPGLGSLAARLDCSAPCGTFGFRWAVWLC